MAISPSRGKGERQSLSDRDALSLIGRLSHGRGYATQPWSVQSALLSAARQERFGPGPFLSPPIWVRYLIAENGTGGLHDSLLEEAVRSELVSEMGFSGDRGIRVRFQAVYGRCRKRKGPISGPDPGIVVCFPPVRVPRRCRFKVLKTLIFHAVGELASGGFPERDCRAFMAVPRRPDLCRAIRHTGSTRPYARGPEKAGFR